MRVYGTTVARKESESHDSSIYIPVTAVTRPNLTNVLDLLLRSVIYVILKYFVSGESV